MEQFSVRYLDNILDVVSHVNGVADVTKSLLWPAMQIEDGPTQSNNWKLVIDMINPEWEMLRYEHKKKDLPILVLEPNELEYAILNHSAEKRKIYTLPTPKIGWHALDCNLRDKRWTLFLESKEFDNLPWVQHTICRYFSALAMSKKYDPLHSSAVSVNGQGALFIGPGGSGKSTFVYLACSRMRASFCSEDMVFLSHDETNQLRASGWPKRVALGSSLLKQEPIFNTIKQTSLRKQKVIIESDDWDHKNKLRFDPDEFFKLFKFNAVQQITPNFVVFPVAKKEMSGWKIREVMNEEAQNLLNEVSEHLEGLRFITDHLRLLPTKAPTQTTSYINELLVLPKVQVAFGGDINHHFKQCWQEIIEITR